VTTTARLLVGALGLATTAYGLVLLVDRGPENLRAAAVWLVVGVLLHDGVLAPLTIVVCAVGGRLLPARLRPPAAGGLLVLGSVTLLAVPVLGRFGARPDNTTLLDRDYTTGWWVVAALTVVTVLAMALRPPRRSAAPDTRERDVV